MTDEESYEIRLTNKALVFYFMAGATGLILSFLAGVMVGRGVDAPGGEVQAARPAGEERVISEETPRPAAAAEDLSYAQRLEGDKPPEDVLEKPRAVPPPTAAKAAPPTPRPAASARPTPAPSVRPTPAARTAAAPAAGSFSIQVGAYKDKNTAESVMARLKERGYAAYVLSPTSGLYNVRVGSFPARPEADRVQARLRDEKFNSFIVKN